MRSTRLKIVPVRKQFPVSAVLALAAGLTLPSMVLADKPAECSAATLRGVYMDQLNGYHIVDGAPQPVSIMGIAVYDGLGNVTSRAISLSRNGSIIQLPNGGNPATYTVEADCTGKLMFSGGTTFDLHIAPSGEHMNILQTNPGRVVHGTSQRVSRTTD